MIGFSFRSVTISVFLPVTRSLRRERSALRNITMLNKRQPLRARGRRLKGRRLKGRRLRKLRGCRLREKSLKQRKANTENGKKVLEGMPAE